MSIELTELRLPLSFWRVLHAEYGIIVYPTALTEDIDICGLNIDATFTETYDGHISMYKFPSQAVCSLLSTYTSDSDVWWSAWNQIPPSMSH